MQRLFISLYQPDAAMEARLPGGVDSMIRFIESVEARLVSAEFDGASGDDRAVTLAVHCSGQVLGWVVSRQGAPLVAEQAYLDAALLGSTPPPVTEGAVVLAVHYAAAGDAGDWTPMPGPWLELVAARAEPVDVESLILEFFELQAAVRRVLIEQWDPIGVGEVEEARDEYDSYAPDLIRMINRQAPANEIFEYLWHVETEHMGLPGDRDHALAIARRLIDLGSRP